MNYIIKLIKNKKNRKGLYYVLSLYLSILFLYYTLKLYF